MTAAETEPDCPCPARSGPGDGDRGADLEYDLAHEAATLVGIARPPDDEVVVMIRQSTDLDVGGDYGYDLAHDLWLYRRLDPDEGSDPRWRW